MFFFFLFNKEEGTVVIGGRDRNPLNVATVEQGVGGGHWVASIGTPRCLNLSIVVNIVSVNFATIINGIAHLRHVERGWN